MNVTLFIVCLVLVLRSSCQAQQCDQTLDVARFDCYPDNGATEEKCLARHCCWHEPTESIDIQSKHSTMIRDVNVPYCYYPKDFPAYEIQSSDETDFGQRIRLNKSKSAFMPDDLSTLIVDLIYESEQRFRLRIYDPVRQRYEVPLPVPTIEKKVNRTDYDVKITDKPFSILVQRKSTGAIMSVERTTSLTMTNAIDRFFSRSLDSIRACHH
jgi:hypothetical protein